MPKAPTYASDAPAWIGREILKACAKAPTLGRDLVQLVQAKAGAHAAGALINALREGGADVRGKEPKQRSEAQQAQSLAALEKAREARTQTHDQEVGDEPGHPDNRLSNYGTW
jgi:hypothetical protein